MDRPFAQVPTAGGQWNENYWLSQSERDVSLSIFCLQFDANLQNFYQQPLCGRSSAKRILPASGDDGIATRRGQDFRTFLYAQEYIQPFPMSSTVFYPSFLARTADRRALRSPLAWIFLLIAEPRVFLSCTYDEDACCDERSPRKYAAVIKQPSRRKTFSHTLQYFSSKSAALTQRSISVDGCEPVFVERTFAHKFRESSYKNSSWAKTAAISAN